MRMNAIHPALTTAALAAFLFTGMPAVAEVVSYKADLKGSAEVPPNDSRGTGSLQATYDTMSKALTWTVTYSGLTGPATAAHFHGPAAAAANAPPVVPVTGDLASPVKGTTTLTEPMAAELQGGNWYFNIHTAANKGGELRGQVVKK